MGLASGLAKLTEEGLKTLDFGAGKNLLNRYYSNLDRGSKLTTRGQSAKILT